MTTEKQYFTRQIDRDTFVKIMTEEHNKLLELRSTIAEKKREISDIISIKHMVDKLLKFPSHIVRDQNFCYQEAQ